MLAVFLFMYLGSGSIRRLYLRAKMRLFCCGLSDPHSNQLKEEVVMFQKEDATVLSEKKVFSNSGSDGEHSSPRDDLRSDNDSGKSNKSYNNVPISASLQNSPTKLSPSKNFVQTPLILFTPSTPLPTHSTPVDVNSSRFSIESGSDINCEETLSKSVL